MAKLLRLSVVIGYVIIALYLWNSHPLYEIKKREDTVSNLSNVNHMQTLNQSSYSQSNNEMKIVRCPFEAPDTPNYNGGWYYTEELIKAEHFLFDPGFGKALIKLCDNQSVVDIGGGVGQLGYFIRRQKANVTWIGFDGGNNIESFWNKTISLYGARNFKVQNVCWIDASEPIILGEQFDWTVSIEVGEHIPQRSESVFLDNLILLCKKGVILTWAIEGQSGYQHINERNNDYIIAKMSERNMTYDINQTMIFRNAVSKLYWLKNTIMVFRK